MNFKSKQNETKLTPQDEQNFNKLLSFMREQEKKLNKSYIVNPQKGHMVEKVIEKIKEILDFTPWDYSITIEDIACFHTNIFVKVIVEMFETAPINHHLFKDIVNEVNSFSASTISEDKVKITFSVHDFYLELKK